MKKLIILSLLFASCNRIEYKYHIIGKVITKDGYRRAEWYTDTLGFNKDTAFYENTDGSVVKIYPPYEIYELNNN